MRRLSEEWLTHRSVMVQMPTGTGKTHVLAAVGKQFSSHDGKEDGLDRRTPQGACGAD